MSARIGGRSSSSSGRTGVMPSIAMPRSDSVKAGRPGCIRIWFSNHHRYRSIRRSDGTVPPPAEGAGKSRRRSSSRSCLCAFLLPSAAFATMVSKSCPPNTVVRQDTRVGVVGGVDLLEFPVPLPGRRCLVFFEDRSASAYSRSELFFRRFASSRARGTRTSFAFRASISASASAPFVVPPPRSIPRIVVPPRSDLSFASLSEFLAEFLQLLVV